MVLNIVFICHCVLHLVLNFCLRAAMFYYHVCRINVFRLPWWQHSDAWNVHGVCFPRPCCKHSQWSDLICCWWCIFAQQYQRWRLELVFCSVCIFRTLWCFTGSRIVGVPEENMLNLLYESHPAETQVDGLPLAASGFSRSPATKQILSRPNQFPPAPELL